MPVSKAPGCDFPEHHKSGSSLGLIIPLAILAGVGYAVYGVIEMVAEFAVAILSVAAVVTAAAATTLVIVLGRQRGRTHLDAPQWVVQRLGALPSRSSAALPVRPAATITGRPSRAIGAPAIHYHLHLHAAPAAQPVALEEDK